MSEDAAPRSRWARFSPAHGWRNFITELAIVVFGVLIALGAQQLVDSWRSRNEVADFRAALDDELASSLSAYRARAALQKCVTRKLDQLDQWQRDWRDGDGPAANGTIGRPLGFVPKMGVWRSGAQTVVGEMPLKQRLAYSSVYDGLEQYEGLRLREAAVWLQLFAFDGARQLTPTETNTLRGLILSARTLDQSVVENYPVLAQQAAGVGVRPQVLSAAQKERFAHFVATSGLCSPLTFSRPLRP